MKIEPRQKFWEGLVGFEPLTIVPFCSEASLSLEISFKPIMMP